MIEKSFEKSYAIDSTQSVFTRVANRMLKEYKAVFGESCIPNEIMQAHDLIKEGKEVEEYYDDYTHEMVERHSGVKMYDKCTITQETRVVALYDSDEYGEPIYYVSWYFYDNILYEKSINGKKVFGNDFQKFLKRVYETKGKYRFFCTHRPPTAGCIPKGWVSYETYSEKSINVGEVTYNEMPPANEIEKWGLVYDFNYERERRYYIEIDEGGGQ